MTRGGVQNEATGPGLGPGGGGPWELGAESRSSHELAQGQASERDLEPRSRCPSGSQPKCSQRRVGRGSEPSVAPAGAATSPRRSHPHPARSPPEDSSSASITLGGRASAYGFGCRGHDPVHSMETETGREGKPTTRCGNEPVASGTTGGEARWRCPEERCHTSSVAPCEAREAGMFVHSARSLSGWGCPARGCASVPKAGGNCQAEGQREAGSRGGSERALAAAGDLGHGGDVGGAAASGCWDPDGRGMRKPQRPPARASSFHAPSSP